MTILAGLVVLAVLPLWFATVAGSLSLHSSDAAGNGLAVAFTFACAVFLWSALAILFLLASWKGVMPAWSPAAACALLPASCAAVLAVIHILSRRDAPQWLFIVPALLPLCFLLLCAMALIPKIRQILPASSHAAAWILILVLTVLPWPPLAALPGNEKKRIAGFHAAQLARQQEFQKLTAAAPLRDWLQFTAYDSELREPALRAIRQLDRRQSDAEQMLVQGDTSLFRDLGDLDLKLTPSLCTNARKLLATKARSFVATHKKARFHDVRTEVESYEQALVWLAAQRCPIQPELAAFEAAILSYADSDQGALILAHLADLRQSLEKENPRR